MVAGPGERPAGESPRYVAIITDGNGRWAQRRGLPAVAGHEAGADTVKARLRDAVEGLPTLHSVDLVDLRLADERLREEILAHGVAL